MAAREGDVIVELGAKVNKSVNKAFNSITNNIKKLQNVTGRRVGFADVLDEGGRAVKEYDHILNKSAGKGLRNYYRRMSDLYKTYAKSQRKLKELSSNQEELDIKKKKIGKAPKIDETSYQNYYTKSELKQLANAKAKIDKEFTKATSAMFTPDDKHSKAEIESIVTIYQSAAEKIKKALSVLNNKNAKPKAIAGAKEDLEIYTELLEQAKNKMREFTFAKGTSGANAQQEYKDLETSFEGFAKQRESKKVKEITEKLRKLKKQLKENADATKHYESVSKSAFENMAEASRYFVKAGLNTIKKSLKSVYTAGKKVTRVLYKEFNQLVSPFTKLGKKAISLKDAIRLIVQYGFGFRSLYYLVRRFRNAIAEGFTYMSNSLSDVKDQIDRLKETIVYLKAATATFLQPLLNWIAAIKDFIQQFVQWFNKLAVSVGTFFATLVGQDYIYVATTDLEKYKTALDDANESAKDLSKTLGAYDKLNVINQDTERKSSKISDIDTSQWFTKQSIDTESWANKFAEAVKNAWKEVDFLPVGEIVSEKLTEKLSKFNSKFKEWTDEATGEVKKGFTQFFTDLGTDVSTFFIGLFTNPELAKNIGEAIANTLNTALAFVKSLIEPRELEGETTDIFSSYSDFIVNLINSALDNINIPDVVNTIVEVIDKITNAILDIIDRTDDEKVGEIVTGFVNILIKLFTSQIQLFVAAAGKIITSVFEALANGTEQENRNLPVTMAMAPNTMTAGISTESFKELGESIGKIISKIPADSLKEGLNVFVSTLWNTLKTTLETWEGENPASYGLVMGLVNGAIALLAAGTILKPLASAIFAALGKSIVEGFLAAGGLKGLLETAGIWIYVKWDDVIKPLLIGLGGALKGIITTIGTWITGTLIPWLTGVAIPAIGAVLTNPVVLLVAAAVALIGILIYNFWDDIVQWFKDAYHNIVKAFTDIRDSASALWKELCDRIDFSWSGLWDSLKELWGNLRKGFDDMGEAIAKSVRMTWDDIVQDFKNRVNSVIGFINGLVRGVCEGVNFVCRALNKLQFDDVPKWVTTLTGITTFGFNLKGIQNIPQIPLLAQGAVIPPNRKFLAMLGDQSHGTNIEAPLDTIKQAVAEVLGSGANNPIILQLDGKTVAQVVWDENEKRYKQTGRYAW